MTNADLFELILIAMVFDGILTLINLCVLGIAVKLVTEFYKVTRLAAPKGDSSLSQGTNRIRAKGHTAGVEP
jgi:hypothetical protein